MIGTGITYHEFEPHILLRDYVKSYWHFKKTSAQPYPFDIMPDGYFDLIISFDADAIVSIRLTGVWSKMATVDHNFAETIGIRFKPLALYSLLNLRLKELLDESSMVHLNDWSLTGDILQDKRSRSVEEVLKYIEGRLLLLLNKEKYDKRLRNLFELINQSSGAMSVEAISDKIGLSTRQAHRRISELIGIGTKDYAKIVRFKDSLELIKDNRTDFVGYFDQSHFIKDFKSYTGFTPNSVDLKNDVRFLQYYDFDKD